MVSLPHVLTNDTLADATEVQDNDNALNNGLSSLRNANIATDAGIASSKLAERYAASDDSFQLLPYSLDADLTNADQFTTLPTALTTIYRRKFRLRSGQLCWLAEVEFFVVHLTTGGTEASDRPQLNVLLDGVQIGGSIVPIKEALAYYSLANSNPIDNPLLPVNDGSVLEVQINKIGEAAVGIAGVTGRIVDKRSFVP